MKKYILLLVTVLATMVSFGQEMKDQKSPCDIELISKEYPVVFASFEDQTNFSRLTDFIKRRETQLKDFVTKTGSGKILISSNSLKSIVEELTIARLNSGISISTEESNISRLELLLTKRNEYQKKNDKEKNEDKIKSYHDSLFNIDRQITQFPFNKISLSKELAEKVIPLCISEKIPGPFLEDGKFYIFTSSLDYIIGDLKNNRDQGIKTCDEVARKSIENMQADIDDASRQLQKITSQEAQHQDFKKYITTAVTILLGLILVAFFGGVLYKSGNEVKAKLISESGLQFITIFVIIIAVILFGIMNILKGSELAAILSAIAGYILGKTAPPKSEKTLELELETLKMQEVQAARLKEEEMQRKADEKAQQEKEEADRIVKDNEENKKKEEEAKQAALDAENKNQKGDNDTSKPQENEEKVK